MILSIFGTPILIYKDRQKKWFHGGVFLRINNRITLAKC